MADGWARNRVVAYASAGTTTTGTLPSVRPMVAPTEARPEGGIMTARLTGPTSGAAWLVRRITVSTPGGTTARRAYVYVGEPSPETLIMGTRSGQLDCAVEDPPLYVPDSTPLVIQWEGAPSRALARVEYQEV